MHCIGPGSIGSLLCFHLQPLTPVNLLLRSRQAQHRRSSPTLSIQLEHQNRTRTATGFTYEFLSQQQQQPIESLLVTTKAPHVLESLQRVRHRLSAKSTVVLLHNGLGVLEEVIENCFREPGSRPTFVLAITSHGVHRIDQGTADVIPGSHGRFCHAGVGDIRLGVVLSSTMRTCLDQAITKSSPVTSLDEEDFSQNQSFSHTPQDDNPLLNPLSETKPVLAQHLPDMYSETRSLYHTMSSLLHPSVVAHLNTKWLSLSEFQTSALIKLTTNAVINPISALVETRNESFHRSSPFESLSQQICQEASAVFAAQSGKPLPPHHPLSVSNLRRVVAEIVFATRPNISSMCADIRTLATNRISAPNTLSKLNLARIASSLAPVKPINPQSALEGMPKSINDTSTEVDYINGYICRLGAKHGIETNVNEALLNLIKLKSIVIKSGKALPRLPRVNRKLKINRTSSESNQESSLKQP